MIKILRAFYNLFCRKKLLNKCLLNKIVVEKLGRRRAQKFGNFTPLDPGALERH